MRRLRGFLRGQLRQLGYDVVNLSKDYPLEVFLPNHLRAVFDRLDVNCVIDVGANHGQFASMIRRAGYRGLIISIEPQSDSYAILAAAARGDSLWRTLNVALGERDEDALINVFESSDLNSFLQPSNNLSLIAQAADVKTTQQVRVSRLDSIFDSLINNLSSPKVFVKLDTQGYDLQVLDGARRSLSAVVAVQSELSVIPLYEGMANYIQALNIYRELGFEPTGIFPVAYDPITKHVLEFDAVLTLRASTPNGAA